MIPTVRYITSTRLLLPILATDAEKKAFSVWSDILDNKIKFNIVNTPYQSDIKIYWVRQTDKALGMQYFEKTMSEYSQIRVSIGVCTKNNKVYSSDKLYSLILHEIGHVFGLGHSNCKKDVMCVYADIMEPSKNDIFVLKLIYEMNNKSTYQENLAYIKKRLDEQYISKKQQHFAGKEKT